MLLGPYRSVVLWSEPLMSFWRLTLPTATNGTQPPAVSSEQFTYDEASSLWRVEIPSNALANPLSAQLDIMPEASEVMRRNAGRLEVEAFILPSPESADCEAPWRSQLVARLAVDQAGVGLARCGRTSRFSVSWPRAPGLPYAVVFRIKVCVGDITGVVSSGELDTEFDPDPADILQDARGQVMPLLLRQNAPIRVTKFTENESALPGSPLYLRFLAAWRQSTARDVIIAFHGTHEHNIENILRESLDPRRRAGQALGPGEYFGKDVMTSLSYCKSGKRMMVFAILHDRAGITNETHNTLVVNRPDFQIPLGVVDFEYETSHRMLGGFSFGGFAFSASSAPTVPFGGVPQLLSKAQSGFHFGPPASASSAPHTFSGLSFGAPAAPTAALKGAPLPFTIDSHTRSDFNFKFGSPSSAPSATPGFNFGPAY